MTDKQTEFDATMEALSGMVDENLSDPMKAVLNRALDLHHQLRGRSWVARVKHQPTERRR